jgi:nicotinic acid mononucleotide adenylyltransferase
MTKIVVAITGGGVNGIERIFQLQPTTPREEGVGVGVTASLKVDNEREGRQHRCFIAIHKDISLWVFSLNLYNDTRLIQEKVIASVITDILNKLDGSSEMDYEAMFNCCHFNYQLTYYYPTVNWDVNKKIYAGDVYKGNIRCATAKTGYGTCGPHEYLIFPGSWNPCHPTHIEMVEYAKKRFPDKKVCAELSLSNFEKPTIDYRSLDTRVASIPSVFDNVFVTNAPLFTDKADIFQGCTFIVGTDTLNRISLDEQDVIFGRGCNFLVFPRLDEDDKPYSFKMSLYNANRIIQANDFPPTKISSRKIRTVKV